jgi:hypothetical protein
MTQRGYGDSQTQGQEPDQEGAEGQGSLAQATERSIAGVQGSRNGDEGSQYRAGSPQGGSASGEAMTSGGTGGYGGGGFDQTGAPESGQVKDEGRSFQKAEGTTPQRGENGNTGDPLLGPKGDPAEGSRDQGATGRGPLDTGPA